MVTAIHDIPGALTANVAVPARAAGDATASHVVFLAPFRCRVRSVAVVPAAAITGANTNYANFNLILRPANTELANIDFTSGVDRAAFVPFMLYQPTAPVELAAGTVLDLQRELVGSGIATPALLVVVTYEGA